MNQQEYKKYEEENKMKDENNHYNYNRKADFYEKYFNGNDVHIGNQSKSVHIQYSALANGNYSTIGEDCQLIASLRIYNMAITSEFDCNSLLPSHGTLALKKNNEFTDTAFNIYSFGYNEGYLGVHEGLSSSTDDMFNKLHHAEFNTLEDKRVNIEVQLGGIVLDDEICNVYECALIKESVPHAYEVVFNYDKEQSIEDSMSYNEYIMCNRLFSEFINDLRIIEGTATEVKF